MNNYVVCVVVHYETKMLQTDSGSCMFAIVQLREAQTRIMAVQKSTRSLSERNYVVGQLLVSVTILVTD